MLDDYGIFENLFLWSNIMTTPIDKTKISIGDEQVNKPINGIVNKTITPLGTTLNTPEKISDKKEEKKELVEVVQKEDLLTKPNMTINDKEGMLKVIDFLVAKNMDTPENFKKIYDNVHYGVKNGVEYIQTWPTKWTKEDITTNPVENKIFQHGDVSYFERSEEMIAEQNALLAKEGKQIPLDSDFEQSMQALPGTYKRIDQYVGGNILALLVNMSLDGYRGVDGELNGQGYYWYRWAASSPDDYNAYWFEFGRYGGTFSLGNRHCARPIRPVLR